MSAPQMDESSRKELEQFLQVEQQKARFQQQVHTFTDTCWDKCTRIASPFTENLCGQA